MEFFNLALISLLLFDLLPQDARFFFSRRQSHLHELQRAQVLIVFSLQQLLCIGVTLQIALGILHTLHFCAEFGFPFLRALHCVFVVGTHFLEVHLERRLLCLERLVASVQFCDGLLVLSEQCFRRCCVLVLFLVR